MSDGTRVILIILVVAAVTLAIRVLPFIIFGKRRIPPFVDYLGRYLPYAVMGMLVVYCLKSTSLISAPFGLPEAISVLVVVILHTVKRNTLLSIVAGTACYMILLQLFA